LRAGTRPSRGEYLYLQGFPGDDAKVAFGVHHQRSTGVITHECAYDPILDDESPKVIDGYHICLSSSPASASVIEGPNTSLPRTRGMSGSFLWNTRYKEMTDQGRQWSPQDARITALVWGDSTKARMLIATPIEFVRSFLNAL
jgi:hypothetical protein